MAPAIQRDLCELHRAPKNRLCPQKTGTGWTRRILLLEIATASRARAREEQSWPGICDLIVVFDERNENLRGNAESGRSTQRFLPRERLALVKKALFRGRNKFLRRAPVVAVVGLAATG